MDKKKYFSHETAIIETEQIGSGTKIWAFCHICTGAIVGENCVIGERVYIGPNVRIGNNVKIQNNSLIYEGVTIEDGVFVGPNVVTTNDIEPKASGPWKSRFKETLFEKECSIGANSTIICGNTVGSGSLVGAGSVVTKDVKSNTIVVGNPAKFLRKKKCPQ